MRYFHSALYVQCRWVALSSAPEYLSSVWRCGETGPQAVSDTQDIVSRLSEAFLQLKTEFVPGKESLTSFVSARGPRPSESPGAGFSLSLDQTVLDYLIAAQTGALKDLKPANMDAEEREMCLPGTRVDILHKIFVSLIHPDAGNNIIWLRGPAGSGKSTILSTLAHYSLQLCRQGGFLFWDRNNPDNSEPRHVIRTLAH